MVFTVAEVQQMATIRKQRDALLEQVAVYKDNIKQLDDRIASLQQQLAKSELIDTLGTETRQLWQARLKDAQDTRKDLELKVSNLEQALRKERRKTFWVGVGGVAAALAGFVLWLTK